MEGSHMISDFTDLSSRKMTDRFNFKMIHGALTSVGCFMQLSCECEFTISSVSY